MTLEKRDAVCSEFGSAMGFLQFMSVNESNLSVIGITMYLGVDGDILRRHD